MSFSCHSTAKRNVWRISEQIFSLECVFVSVDLSVRSEIYTVGAITKFTMQLSFVLSSFGLFFYLIGQSTYKPSGKTKMTHRSVLSSLPHFTFFGAYLTVVTLLTVAGLALAVKSVLSPDEEGTPLLVIGVVITACSNFAAILQCRLYPHSLEMVHQLFTQVDHLFRLNFRQTIFYESYRNEYLVKFGTLVALYLIDFFTVVVLNVVNGKEVPVTTIALLLMVISVFGHSHALFYIGLHVFIYAKFCKIIDSNIDRHLKCVLQLEDTCLVPQQSRNSRKIITKIQIYKIIHFKLWVASQMVSEYFGWEIIVSYLQNFLHMTNSAFHIYLFAQNGHLAEAGIMRTY